MRVVGPARGTFDDNVKLRMGALKLLILAAEEVTALPWLRFYLLIARKIDVEMSQKGHCADLAPMLSG